MKKIWFFWKELMATFWFVPVLIVFLSVFMSAGLVYLDSEVQVESEGWLRFFLVSSADSARSILSTISGAMIGVAGTVFSITLVALTLASSQFGPRLIKNFMYVRLNQVVLGSYVSTYLYCLFVLSAIKANDDVTFLPSISILVAIVVAMGNIILLIVFIHQIAVSIQADKVISDIADFISEQVTTLFPDDIGEEADTSQVDVEAAKIQYQCHRSIASPSNGYLQYIDSEKLISLLSNWDVLLELHHRPGSHLVIGMEIGRLHTHAELTDKEVDELLDQFVIGKSKTAQQDLEFSIHQMVEIASRALSPGVNDPYTAIACIDNLTATMCYLARADWPSPYRMDGDEELRIIANNLTFEGVLDAAFHQIRQFSGGSPAVIIRLMEALTTILGFARIEAHKEAVIRHAQMVRHKGRETIQEENDLEDLERRARSILE